MENDFPDSSEKDFSNFLYGSFDTEVVPRSFLHEQNQWESIFEDDRDPLKYYSQLYREQQGTWMCEGNVALPYV